MKCVLRTRALVGECPRWHPLEQKLYWVDIYEPSVNCFDPASGENRRWMMPERIGCFAFRKSGGLVAGMQSGIAFVTLGDTPAVKRVFEFDPANKETRFNDGRCDPAGRFWAGTIEETLTQPVGTLYRFDPDGRCTPMVNGLVCANGLGFSPDGRTLYHSDSRQDQVWAWDFDNERGAIANRRTFIAMDGKEGRPDGAAVDAEGYYWICHVGAWHVARYAPDGTIDRVVGVPVQRPTMCAFGGKNLDVLYVTSATFPLSKEALAKQPLAGSLFALDAGVRGLPEPFFAG
jgi:sugar lactone lactonase YvrE